MLTHQQLIHPPERHTLSFYLVLFVYRSLYANFLPAQLTYGSPLAPLLCHSLRFTSHQEFLLLSDMADDTNTIALEEALASTSTDEERIILLHKLCNALQYSQPHRAIQIAKEALGLSATLKDKTAQAKSYLYIGTSYLQLADYERVHHYLKKAEKLTAPLNNQELIINILIAQGRAHANTGNYTGSVQALTQAREICEEVGSPQLAIVLNNLAPVYSQLGDYAMGLECLYRSLPLYEAAGESTASVELHIGYIYGATRNREKAREHIERALHISRDRGDLRGEGTALKNLATILIESGELDTGMAAAQEALEIARRIDNPTMAILSMQSIAVCHFNAGRSDESLRWNRETLELAEGLGKQDVIGVQKLNIACVYQHQERDNEAIALANEVLAIAQQIGYRELEQNAHELLYQLYEHLGDASAALQHFKHHAAMKEQLLGQQTQNAINRIQIRAEMEKAERDREILRLKAERLELEMQHKSKELTALAMQLVQKNEMLDELKKQIGDLAAAKNGSAGAASDLTLILRQIDTSRNSEQEWEIFEQQFRALHPGFMDSMAQQCSELSPTELKVCALMKINLATKEIANILCCSVRTVEDHRYSVRSKLNLPKGTNLGSYLASVQGHSGVVSAV